MIFVVGLLIILAIFVYMKYNKQEHFTMFTANPVYFIDSNCMDKASRHVRLSHSGNIMYVSNRRPTEANCKNIKCPSFIDKSLTLGDSNYCWKC